MSNDNYRHSGASIGFGAVSFLFFYVLSIVICDGAKTQMGIKSIGGWLCILIGISFYGALLVARLIARYQCGIASPFWTNLFDKSIRSIQMTVILTIIFMILGKIVGKDGGADIFLLLIVASPIMSIYYVFLHPALVRTVRGWMEPAPTHYGSVTTTTGSWMKDKIIPAIITSTLPVLLAYALTNNVHISIGASLIGNLFSLGKRT